MGRAQTIRGLERASGKGVALAEGQVYLGNPDAWKRDLAWNQAGHARRRAGRREASG